MKPPWLLAAHHIATTPRFVLLRQAEKLHGAAAVKWRPWRISFRSQMGKKWQGTRGLVNNDLTGWWLTSSWWWCLMKPQPLISLISWCLVNNDSSWYPKQSIILGSLLEHLWTSRFTETRFRHDNDIRSCSCSLITLLPLGDEPITVLLELFSEGVYCTIQVCWNDCNVTSCWHTYL